MKTDSNNNDISTYFHNINQGNKGIVSNMLNKIPINTIDNNGNTGINIACENEHIDIVKLLIENGDNIHKKNNNGDSPFNTACRKGNVYIMSLLIRHGANTTTKNNNGDAPIQTLARYNNLNALKSNQQDILKFFKSEINYGNRDGDAAIHITSREGYFDFFKYLIDNNAFINKINKNNERPIDILRNHNRIDYIYYALKIYPKIYK